MGAGTAMTGGGVAFKCSALLQGRPGGGTVHTVCDPDAFPLQDLSEAIEISRTRKAPTVGSVSQGRSRGAHRRELLGVSECMLLV